jgi:hypothetical protein
VGIASRGGAGQRERKKHAATPHLALLLRLQLALVLALVLAAAAVLAAFALRERGRGCAADQQWDEMLRGGERDMLRMKFKSDENKRRRRE